MATTQITEISKAPVPLLVKPKEVASLLSVSLQTVHNLIESGDLKASRIGPKKCKERQHLRVTQESLFKFYEGRFGHCLLDAIKHRFKGGPK